MSLHLLNISETDVLVAARDAFRSDIDDDLCDAANRGYRHPEALTSSAAVSWELLLELGYLEYTVDDSGDWYRATDKCWEAVFNMEHESA